MFKFCYPKQRVYNSVITVPVMYITNYCNTWFWLARTLFKTRASRTKYMCVSWESLTRTVSIIDVLLNLYRFFRCNIDSFYCVRTPHLAKHFHTNYTVNKTPDSRQPGLSQQSALWHHCNMSPCHILLFSLKRSVTMFLPQHNANTTPCKKKCPTHCK